MMKSPIAPVTAETENLMILAFLTSGFLSSIPAVAPYAAKITAAVMNAVDMNAHMLLYPPSRIAGPGLIGKAHAFRPAGTFSSGRQRRPSSFSG